MCSSDLDVIPGAPVIAKSVAPVIATSATPVIVKSVDVIPGVPVIMTPSASVIVTPAAPAIVKSVAPVIVTPAAPAIVKSFAPAIIAPVIPLAVAPVVVTPVLQAVPVVAAPIAPTTAVFIKAVNTSTAPSPLPLPLPAAVAVAGLTIVAGGAALTSSTPVVTTSLSSSCSVPNPVSTSIKPLSTASAISPFAELTSSTGIEKTTAAVTVAVAVAGAQVGAIPSESVPVTLPAKLISSPSKKVSKDVTATDKEEEGMTDREERIEKKSGKVTEVEKIKGEDAMQTKNEVVKVLPRGNMSVVMRSTTGRQANTVVLIKPTEGML